MILRNPSGVDQVTCHCQGLCNGHEELAIAQSQNDEAIVRLSRRNILRRTVVGAAAGVLASAGIELAAPGPARAQSPLSPEAALQALMDGNKRFVERSLTFHQEDLAILQQNTAVKQEPYASVLSCADSRVPVELLFDQSIGHVFVNRVAGNIATSEIIASIEYGVAVLGTKAIMVLGHSNCGAVKASIAAKAVPGQISALYSYIRPAVDLAGTNVDEVGRANVKIQAAILRESSPVLAEMIQKKSLTIVGGFYDLASGKVALVS
jgi:carbonic anhydrase